MELNLPIGYHTFHKDKHFNLKNVKYFITVEPTVFYKNRLFSDYLKDRHRELRSPSRGYNYVIFDIS